jgi:predicted Zn-dependent peptidase
MRGKTRTLANGLPVVVTPARSLHRVAITLFVGVGSRFEGVDDNGISHFLEHMLYRGTAKHPSAHAQNLAFERLGGTLYAATHADHTTLSITLPPTSVAPALALLGRLLERPRFGEIEVERRIVREEILEDLDEDGRQVDPDNVVRTLCFGDHPLGFPITGPLAHLERFDEPALRAHLARHYVARNMVLSVAGAVVADEVFALADRAFGKLPSGAPVTPPSFVADQQKARRAHVASPGSQTDLRVSFLTPGERHPLAPAIELMMRVIDDGMSTRLYHRLCDAGGLVYDCSAGWEPFLDCGIVDFAAEVAHDRVVEVTEACLEIARALAVSGPTKAEVDKARARHRWDVESAVDDAAALADFAGSAAFFERERDLAAHAARYDGVGRADVRRAAAAIFRADRLSIVTVGSLSHAARDRLRKAIASFS